jgi:SAM-dependent methyltransferase
MASDRNQRSFPKRPCPVCGGTSTQLLFQQSFEQLSGISLLDRYDVVICEACGAGYADDIPQQAVFDDYYRDLSKYDYADRAGTPPPSAEQRFQDTAAILKDAIPSRDSRILEIGSASGQLLAVLRDLGFPNVEGTDPSPGCVRAAEAIYGIPGFAATIFTIPRPAKPYDFLILTGVMEHIRDLDRTIEQFHHLLGPHGRVYLEVPEASRYIPSLDAPFQEFSLEHINYFSGTSLANLMRLRGFRCLELGHTIHSQHEVSCPSVYGVFEKTDEPGALEPDHETGPGLRAYIEGCQAEDLQVRRRIQEAVQAAGRVIVWGVGAHTLRLLANGALNPASIVLFVDSSPKYQNRELRGIRVGAPAELSGRREPILISSRGFQSEIQHQIRDDLKLPNPLIVLYETRV